MGKTASYGVTEIEIRVLINGVELNEIHEVHEKQKLSQCMLVVEKP